jgi:hypothetical protein
VGWREWYEPRCHSDFFTNFRHDDDLEEFLFLYMLHGYLRYDMMVYMQEHVVHIYP